MTEIRFYHLTRRPLESALPEILSKAYAKGSRMVVRTPSAQEAEKLNEILWTFNPNAFLPHGNKSDGNADMQPVWLTENEDNPNNADTLFITGTASDVGFEAYSLCCLMFDGHDDEALQLSRTRWKAYKDAGHDLTYWQQTDKGWEKK
jgi:DNA polymerase-3 subunit chi